MNHFNFFDIQEFSQKWQEKKRRLIFFSIFSVFSKINKRDWAELYDLILALLIYITFPNLKSHFGFIKKTFGHFQKNQTEWEHFKTRNQKVYLVSSWPLVFIRKLQSHKNCTIWIKITQKSKYALWFLWEKLFK